MFCCNCGKKFERAKKQVYSCDRCRGGEVSFEEKKVFQWAYRNSYAKHWKMAKTLLTEAEARGYFLDCEITPVGDEIWVSP